MRPCIRMLQSRWEMISFAKKFFLLVFLSTSTLLFLYWTGPSNNRIVRWGTTPNVISRRDGLNSVSNDPDISSSMDNVNGLERPGWRERTIAEMTFIPRSARVELEKPLEYRKKKKIVIVDERKDDPIKDDKSFSTLHCPVSLCSLTTDTSQEQLASADAVLFRHVFHLPDHKRPANQLWVMMLMESPHNCPDLTAFKNRINWTATYRLDSTIYLPYGFYKPFGERRTLQKTNYAAGKTKKVAWVVSNCDAHNGRLQYAKTLQNYIDVDIYGGCGTHMCPKTGDCLEMLKRNYKFYLSFENTNCRDYITEKLFRNPYSNNMIPIVMGAHPDDYKQVAPPKSFIHVDDFPSPKELADYLHKLDKDDTLYNAYFEWKQLGAVDPTYSYGFYCRLCAKLWAEKKTTRIDDVNGWWRGDGVCAGH